MDSVEYFRMLPVVFLIEYFWSILTFAWNFQYATYYMMMICIVLAVFSFVVVTSFLVRFHVIVLYAVLYDLYELQRLLIYTLRSSLRHGLNIQLLARNNVVIHFPNAFAKHIYNDLRPHRVIGVRIDSYGMRVSFSQKGTGFVARGATIRLDREPNRSPSR